MNQNKIGKSITIHGIDKETEKLIKERAKSSGTSVNKVVKELLSRALGLERGKKDHRDEFVDLFGVWSDDDEKQFSEATKDLEAVSSEDWK